jgi:hypothetical protein
VSLWPFFLGYLVAVVICLGTMIYHQVKPHFTIKEPTTYAEALEGLMNAKTTGEILYYRRWLKRLKESGQANG